MSIATLQDIITKIRRLTGSGNSNQLTDSQIIDYVNSYYLYDFPAQYRTLKLKDQYTFNTQRGIDVYPFDSEHFSTVEMPCYCMNREIALFNNPWNFFAVNYNWQFQENFATTTAALGAGPYTGTVQSTPIIRSVNNNPMVITGLNPTTSFITSPSKPSFVDSTTNPNAQVNISRVQNILITVNTALGSTLNVTDNGNQVLIGDGSGTINYDTGAISVTFSSAPPAGESIQIQYNPQKLSIPLSILFFQNQFTLRPVPDRGYTITLVAYRLPSQALLGTTSTTAPTLTGQPEQNEWWELVAVGASKKVYEDRLDMDGVGLMNALMQEKLALVETRTYAQLGKQRMATITADQLQNSYGSSGWGFGNTP